MHGMRTIASVTVGVDPPGTIHHLFSTSGSAPRSKRKDLIGDGDVQLVPLATIDRHMHACLAAISKQLSAAEVAIELETDISKDSVPLKPYVVQDRKRRDYEKLSIPEVRFDEPATANSC